MPLDPTDPVHSWAFHVINDELEAFEWIVVERVSYVWGDFENGKALNLTFGPLAASASVEVHRETDTELRTGLTLRVGVSGRERCVYAEVSRLYSPPRGVVDDIPILGGRGKLAELH